MLKKLLAIVGGLFVGIVLIIAIEMLSHAIFPPPSAADSSSYKVYFDNLPIGALLFVVLAHVVGSLLGGFTAFKIEKTDNKSALIVSGFLLVATVMNLGNMMAMGITPPLWYLIVDPLSVVFVVFGFIKFLPNQIVEQTE